MNEPKVTDLDYINFLLAAPRVVSCTEGARVQPDGSQPVAHDALNRLLNRLEADTAPLWQEAEQLLDRTRGLLIIDDTTLTSRMHNRLPWCIGIGLANIIGLSRASIWSPSCGVTIRTPSHAIIACLMP